MSPFDHTARVPKGTDYSGQTFSSFYFEDTLLDYLHLAEDTFSYTLWFYKVSYYGSH